MNIEPITPKNIFIHNFQKTAHTKGKEWGEVYIHPPPLKKTPPPLLISPTLGGVPPVLIYLCPAKGTTCLANSVKDEVIFK